MKTIVTKFGGSSLADSIHFKKVRNIIESNSDRKYVIPLSSAKVKHKTWKNVDKECYLIYETAKKSCMGQDDIWVATEHDTVKHILSVMDIKKMIPNITHNIVSKNPIGIA